MKLWGLPVEIWDGEKHDMAMPENSHVKGTTTYPYDYILYWYLHFKGEEQGKTTWLQMFGS